MGCGSSQLSTARDKQRDESKGVLPTERMSTEASVSHDREKKRRSVSTTKSSRFVVTLSRGEDMSPLTQPANLSFSNVTKLHRPEDHPPSAPRDDIHRSRLALATVTDDEDDDDVEPSPLLTPVHNEFQLTVGSPRHPRADTAEYHSPQKNGEKSTGAQHPLPSSSNPFALLSPNVNTSEKFPAPDAQEDQLSTTIDDDTENQHTLNQSETGKQVEDPAVVVNFSKQEASGNEGELNSSLFATPSLLSHTECFSEGCSSPPRTALRRLKHTPDSDPL